jgi:hypothetical protein
MATQVPVTVDNFVRAESDLYFSSVVKKNGFGKFDFNRELTPIDEQTVIRMNRDTLYGGAVFDLDAGHVAITLPDPGKRFLSMQVIDEDQYTEMVVYGAGRHVLSRPNFDTRYVLCALRILVDPRDPLDLKQVHALQDAVRVQMEYPGKFEHPPWDMSSQKAIREALLTLGASLPDSGGMFGTKEDVSPVRRLIGAAMAWGGNPERDARYLNFTPARNDGHTIYRLRVRDVPVDGFWSISVYNAQGYFEKNEHDAYTINNLTAVKDADGAVTVQFGGFDGNTPNCLPIVRGWSYMVRLYRPRAEILSGKWAFPHAQAMQ